MIAKFPFPQHFYLDHLMALRYCYYVKHISIVEDKTYDDMEDVYTTLWGDLPVGSEKKDSYTKTQICLANYWMMSCYVETNKRNLL